MALSMTGFGRSESLGPFGKLVVEIQSVNRKFFEISLSAPKEFGRYEIDLRKQIHEAVFRGQVTVRIQWEGESLRFLPTQEILQKVCKECESMCGSLGLHSSSITLPLLLDLAERGRPLKEFTDEVALQEALAKALDALVLMREQEGAVLIEEVQKHLKILQEKTKAISVLAPGVSLRMKEGLLEKLAPAFHGDAAWDERLAREVALFAEKVDITEELARLRSHFTQFEECCSQKGPVGKKMDFVIQEMGREINTIGSKSNETQISYLVVEMKTELEKIREQVQNIE